MIKIILTPFTFIIDIINMATAEILTLIFFDGKFMDALPSHNNFPWTNLL